MVVSLCVFGFAANPTFNIKSINVAGAGGQIVTADFDNDGNADFAVGTSKGLSVFFGNGAGSFTRVDVGGAAAFLQIADIDGDGHPDLVAADVPTAAQAKIVMHRNNGNRTFTALTPFPVPNVHALMAAGDFDGDGKADLALSMSQLTIEVMVGNGDGTFQAPKTVFTATVPTGVDDPNAYGIDSVQVAADYDGNGKVDFMASAGPTNLFGGDDIWFMLNQGGLTFTPQHFSQQAFTGATALDGNGDGKADVGFTWIGCHTPCGGGDVWTLAGGTPEQIDSASFDDAVQGLPGSPVAADFNGDGQRDIAWVYGTFSKIGDGGTTTPARESVIVHLGPPEVNPTNQQTVQIDVGPDDNFNPEGMATADFNNDGAPDIVVTSVAHNAIHVLLNTTPGVAKQDFRFAVAPATATVAAGQSATMTATLTPTGGFTQQIAFTCSGLPAGAACSFAPSALVPSNGPAKTTLTITTTARTSGALHRTSTTFFALTLPFFGVVCIGAAGSRRRLSRLLLLAALCAVLALTLTACGGFSGSNSATPPPTPPPTGGGGGGGGGTGTSGTAAGTYTVVVTAQGGGLTHATNVTLTVQ